MNKAELITAIAAEVGSSKREARRHLDAAIFVIQETVAEENVALIGFGTFKASKRSARKGINPQTLEEIDIPAKTVPIFSPGKTFTESVDAKSRSKP